MPLEWAKAFSPTIALFTWTEEPSLPLPILGELVLLAYRPFLRRLMRRSLSNLERTLRHEA